MVKLQLRNLHMETQVNEELEIGLQLCIPILLASINSESFSDTVVSLSSDHGNRRTSFR